MAEKFTKRETVVEATPIVNVGGLLRVYEDPYPSWIDDLFKDRGIGNIKSLFYEADESNPAFPKLRAYCINLPDIIDLNEGDWLVKDAYGRVSIMRSSEFDSVYQRVINS